MDNKLYYPYVNTDEMDSNVSDTRPDYDKITFDVPKGMRREVKRLAQEKTGLSLASYLRKLITDDLGVEFDMKPQIADNTGRRKTG